MQENTITEDLNKELKCRGCGAYLTYAPGTSHLRCAYCGTQTTLLPHVTSSECPFCTTTLVLKDGGKKSVLKPKSLLPFKITAKDAFAKFGGWINSLWFAPNDL